MSICACTAGSPRRSSRTAVIKGVICRDQRGPPGDPRRCRCRCHRRSRRRGERRRSEHIAEGSFIVTTVFRAWADVDTDAAERFQFGEPERFAEGRPRSQADHRRLLAILVAENATARRGLVQLPAHDRLRRPQGCGPNRRRVRRPTAHGMPFSTSPGRTCPVSRTPMSSISRRRPAFARPACSKAITSSRRRT